MRIRQLVGCALGVALIASNGWAQEPTRTQKTRSDTRVSISKGEVAIPRADTVVVTRMDTVYSTRFVYDTVRVPMRYDVVRVDTVMVTVPAEKKLFFGGPLYAGFFAGPTMPSGNIDRLYATGFHYGLLAGWEGANQLLGLRVSTDFTHLAKESGLLPAVGGNSTPLMFTFGFDLKMVPWHGEMWQAYGIGGASLAAYRGVAMVSNANNGIPDGRGGYNHPVDGWNNSLGFNVGGGLDFNIAGQEMFLEARAVALPRYGARTWFIPVSLGLRYF